jgi:PAS domain S-box-containing protein
MEFNKAEDDLVNFFRYCLNAISVHTVVVDGAGRPIDYVFNAVNPGFEKMTGLKGSDIVGKSVKTVLPTTEDFWIETFGRVAITGEPHMFESFSQALDKWYEVSAFQHKPMGFTATFMDVTERVKAVEVVKDLNKTLEDKLEQRTADLEKTFRDLIDAERFAVVGQMAAGMAHELNTPLGAIGSANELISHFLFDGFYQALEAMAGLDAEDRDGAWDLVRRTRLLLDRPAVTDRQQRRALQKLALDAGLDFDQDLAEHLVELNADALDLERLAARPALRSVLEQLRAAKVAYRMSRVISEGTQRGAYVVNAFQKYLRGNDSGEMEEFDVAEQLDTVVALFHHRLKRGIEVVRAHQPGIRCRGDRQRLNQVWMNLINNAVHAMGDSGVLTLASAAVGANLTVSVTDTGAGVPEAIRERIFEPYFTTRKHGEGIGLGLSLCRKILTDHGGTLTLDSVPGRTVFTVALPGRAS